MEDYLQKRVIALDSLWADFDSNNAQLSFSEYEITLDYFTKDIYHRNLYDTIRNLFTNYFPTMEVAGMKLAIDELKSEQKSNFRALLRQINNIDTDKIAENRELENELSLQSRWENIDKLYLKIDSVSGDGDKKLEEEYSVYEKHYRDMERLLNRKKLSTVHQFETIHNG